MSAEAIPPLEREFLVWMLDSRRMAESTVAAYSASLRHFWKRMGGPDYTTVTARDLDRYMRLLKIERHLARHTQRRHGYALKAFFNFLHWRGEIPVNPGAGMLPPRNIDERRLPTFTPEEIERLIFSFAGPAPVRGEHEPAAYFDRRLRVYEFSEARDTAGLALAYTCGLRVSEPRRLDLEDYSIDPRGDAWLTLRTGKRSSGPERFPLDRRVQSLIERYLAVRQKLGVSSSALFAPLSGRCRPIGRGVCDERWGEILQRRIELLGLDRRGRKLSFHALRYSICTHLFRDGKGLDPKSLQNLMRHRDIATTFRYIRLGSLTSVRKRAISQLYWNRTISHGISNE